MTHVKFSRRPFEQSFNNLVDDLFSELPVLYKSDLNQKGLIPVNVSETDKAYNIEVVSPGFEKPDFKINVDQNILTISGQKKEEEVVKEGNKQIRKEYSYRSFK